MIDKILKVSENLVVIFFTHKPAITVATDDGSAMALALRLVVDSYRETVRAAA